MEFNPTGNTTIQLGGQTYLVRGWPHESLANQAVCIYAGRSQVYQLIETATGQPYALKVMLPLFRVPQLLRHQALLAQLAQLPGFEACQQTYFTPQTHPADLARYPDLAYASLMPWIPGGTWATIIGSEDEDKLDELVSWELAYQLILMVSMLERHGIAHCDLSGGNVMVDRKAGKLWLIDFDEVYWPQAPQPVAPATGTPGYRKYEENQWMPSGDRFATAILLGELLGWRDARVRARSFSETYFTPDDFHGGYSARYQVLQDFLQDLHPDLGDLFRRAWQAPLNEECPKASEWRMALALGRGWVNIPEEPLDLVKITLPPSASPLERITGTGSATVINYRNRATAKTPAHVIFLVDVSESMTLPCYGRQRITFAHEAIKDILLHMLNLSAKMVGHEPVVRPRFQVAIIGYNEQVYEPYGGFISISDLINEGIPHFRPAGHTNAFLGFQKVEQLLRQVMPRVEEDWPAPLVCHLTDGEYDVGDSPLGLAERIKAMWTADGPVLVESIFISDETLSMPVLDPERWLGVRSEGDLRDDYAIELFRMSSVIPASYLEQLHYWNFLGFQPGARLMFPGERPELIRAALATTGASGGVVR